MPINPEYVRLERRFTDITAEPSSRWSRKHSGPSGEKWEALVPQTAPLGFGRSAVVILGPSGQGKSAELLAYANHLEANGVVTFSMQANKLARMGVQNAVDAPNAFIDWKSRDVEAVFFVDAVDEAKLSGDDLEKVMHQFAKDVDPATKKLRLVLSSRNDVWLDDEARHVVKALALPIGLNAMTSPHSESSASLVRVVRLEPLCVEDVEALVKVSAVADARAFMRALDQEELEGLFEMRPPDVRILTDYWQTHGSFGSWSAMLQAFIEASVRNANRNHASHQKFTYEDATQGLTRLGAASVLGKKSLISWPGYAGNNQVDSERLFWDRPPASVGHLLAMGLFTQKGFHSVQLPQGHASHYLAARWLSERVRRGWDPRALEDELFFRPFGTTNALVPGSRAPMLGWLAGEVAWLRRRLLKELPHVLLFEGDPTRLSRGECVEALRGVLTRLGAGGPELSAPSAILRQLVKHDIADAVVLLLGEFSDADRAVHLLLRIAKAGRYPEVESIGLAFAFDSTREDSVRMAAIRAVASVGSTTALAQLTALAKDVSEWVRFTIVQELVPQWLSGPDLVDLVLATTNTQVAHAIATPLLNASSIDLDEILRKILPIGDVGPGDFVGLRVEPLVEIACQLAAARLGRTTDIPTWLPPLLLMIEEHIAGPIYVSPSIVDAINSHLNQDTRLRRVLWTTRMSHREGSRMLFAARLGAPTPQDIEWFWEEMNAAAETAKFALGRALNLAIDSATDADRLALKSSPAVSAGLKAVLQQWEAQRAHSVTQQEEETAKQRAKLAAQRISNVENVLPNRARIEAGSDERDMVWAWRHLKNAERSRERLDTARLVEVLGDDLANSFIKGLTKWWRNHEPDPREPGETQYLLANVAGLTGLSLSIKDGLDVRSLSDADAAKAVRYALYELNGFPVWFEPLLEAHPTTVRRVLRGVIAREWASTQEHHGVISRAPYEPQHTAELIGQLVVAELAFGWPGHPRTDYHAVSALLAQSLPNDTVTQLIERQVLGASSANSAELAQWLRGWAHFDPSKACKWLRSVKKNQCRELVLQVASSLEEDFDSSRQRARKMRWDPTALKDWVLLLYDTIRPEDDTDRSDGNVYNPNARDYAQSFRNRCLSSLASYPSKEAFEAIQSIRRLKKFAGIRDLLDQIAQRQLAAAAEELASSWTEKQLLELERGDDRIPTTNASLFALVKRHLARVAELLENDDFSYSAVFAEDTEERHIQRWVASSLTLVGRGLYTVEREPQVQDDKLMDISVTVPGVGRVPVEIKPLYKERYTYKELCAFITEQLIGRYMRPPNVDCGILLLVPLISRTWKIAERVVSFQELCSSLQAYAKNASGARYKEVAVSSIDIAASRKKAAARGNNAHRQRSSKT
jgi:hypothetical protein